VATTHASGLETLLDAIDRLPEAPGDLQAAGLLIGDAVGCILGATSAPAAQPVLQWARGQAESPQALAFTLGALSNVLELDAMHVASSVHPGTVVAPAALALAVARNLPAPDLLRAVLRGTEAALRLGRSTGAAHRQSFQSTATCAGVGAALACAELLGLDRGARLDAMGNVASTAGGLWAFIDEDTLTKQWHAGHASQAALACAELAEHGLRGPRHVLDSRRGFHAVLCPDAAPVELGADGTAWQIHGTAYKPWPCPRPVHAAITAALGLHAKLNGAAIESVTVRTFGMAVDLCDRPAPRTPHDARFSVQHGVAAALADGGVDFGSYEPAAIDRLGRLVGSVALLGDADMTRAYPQLSRASVEVRLRDGSTRLEATDHALGDPGLPLDGPTLRVKQETLAARAAGADASLARAAMDAACASSAGMVAAFRQAFTAAGYQPRRPPA
jgi:2-methylcitrate dehydratase PrpD